MAILSSPRYYQSPLSWDDKVRNGKVPDWRVPSQIVQRQNMALAHCRKLVFHKATNPGGTPQGLPTSTTPWRWRFRTGESVETEGARGSIAVRAEAMVLPADGSGALADPRWRIFVGATNSPYRRLYAEVLAPTFDDISSQWVQVEGLNANTEYECGLELEDRCRVVSLTVFEVVALHLDTAADHVSDRRLYAMDQEITDAQHDAFAVTNGYEVFKHNGAHLFNLVPDAFSAAWATSSASFVNMLDATASTTVGANTPGLNVGAEYHNTVETDDVKCVFCVYADHSAGTGGDTVLLVDSGGTIATLSGWSSIGGGEWKTASCNLDGSIARHKLDVHFRDTNSDTLSVYAVSLYEYMA